jgi:hypothetical protein
MKRNEQKKREVIVAAAAVVRGTSSLPLPSWHLYLGTDSTGSHPDPCFTL